MVLNHGDTKLLCRGNFSLLTDKYKRIAIVGSRDSTVKQRIKAYTLGMYYGSGNTCVVSGLAHGVDTFAHTGGIGRTIAVVTDLNDIYPKENRTLAREILAYEGLLIQPLTTYHKNKFLNRDRIIVDISDEIYAISSDLLSTGTGFTVRYAESKNKQVYMLDGNED